MKFRGEIQDVPADRMIQVVNVVHFSRHRPGWLDPVASFFTAAGPQFLN